MVAVLHETACGLAKWLQIQLLRHGGSDWWTHHVCKVVQERDQTRIADGEWKDLEDLDLGTLLNVLMANFRFLTARRALDKEDREILRRMKEVRNRCEGHWPLKGLPRDELEIHLSTVSEFARRFGSGKELLERIDRIRGDVQSQPLCAGKGALDAKDREQAAGAQAGERLHFHLADSFSSEQLTPSQEKAVEALQRFLDDPNGQCFVLKGYAGTGKTFLIGGLVGYLQSVHRRPQMMAPTGRAAHVLRDRHRVEASTIHRHIYSLSSLKEYREVDENGDVTYKFYFELKNNDIEHDTVFIVDEASMISDVYSEAEFLHFGSGRLLSDLFHYINFDANDYRKKVILVGDDAQLPPVGMKSSPALDVAYLREKRLVRATSCTLTDVVRQEESSTILENATRLRELLRENRFTSFDFAADGELVRELPPDALVDAFVQEREGSLVPNSVIIAHKNATTRTYNDAVRSRLFPGIASLTAGDQIIVVANNYRYERPILNGQMGLVMEAAAETEVRTVPLNIGVDESGKRKNITVKLEFREVTLRFSDDRGGPFDVSCRISENCLQNADANVSSEYSKALYVDFRNRNPHLKPSQPEFKEVLKADPYFNAVMLKFGYAITCHKAQGGEWPIVFVDFSGMNKLNSESIRWSYTALTRAKEQVVATNALHHHVLKPAKGPAEGAKGRTNQPPTEFPADRGTSPVEQSGGENLLDDQGRKTPAELIRFLIVGAVPSEWRVDLLKSRPYHARFMIVGEGMQVAASVYYNRKHQITNVQVTPTRELEESYGRVVGLLAALRGRSVAATAASEPVEELDDTHQGFAESLKGRLETLGVRIVGLRSNTRYHLTARMTCGEVDGAVDYYFDGKGRFTRFQTQPGCPPELCAKLDIVHA